MKKEQQTKKVDAFTLFPDLMQKTTSGVQSKKRRGETTRKNTDIIGKKQVRTSKSAGAPPPPPDVSWLSKGIYEDQDLIKDIPTALILMTGGGVLDVVSKTFEKLGYQIEFSETADDAIHKLKSINYAAVVMHAGFEKERTLAASKVHDYITWLPMDRRRLIHYILVGSEFTTLYDLEALSLSANLVVNDADVEHMETIIKKSFNDYRKLIEPFLESLDNCR